MGSNISQFSEEELRDYEDLTYFSKKEILLWVFCNFSICVNLSIYVVQFFEKSLLVFQLQ